MFSRRSDFSCYKSGCSEGRSAFPVYASASASQGGLTARFGIKAENPHHSFLRWDGLQRRLDWKYTSSGVAF
ncbi:hypothetical protein C7R92_01550 [Brevibacillus porteri]|uniref:Uncharacterized protein n=1 Tax=Brevibacillus porteri TaxID=2126350 RepID=A0ABX5FXB0_9BACL|nr:hypothetical protein C7R92_01550 [Brevibacillus porteri]